MERFTDARLTGLIAVARPARTRLRRWQDYVIDLRKQALWEDFYDRALAEQRASEPRERLETVKRRVLGRRRRRG